MNLPDMIRNMDDALALTKALDGIRVNRRKISEEESEKIMLLIEESHLLWHGIECHMRFCHLAAMMRSGIPFETGMQPVEGQDPLKV